jgi:hypothetical protein
MPLNLAPKTIAITGLISSLLFCSFSAAKKPVVKVAPVIVKQESTNRIKMSNGILEIAIDPQRGGRIFEARVKGSGNLANHDWGMASDQPLGLDWNMFRHHPYAARILKKGPQTGAVELTCRLEGQGEVVKIISLKPGENKVYVDYKVTNLGPEKKGVFSVFANFLEVNKQGKSPVVVYPRLKQPLAVEDIPHSDVGVYDKYNVDEMTQARLDGYDPETGYTVRTITYDKNVQMTAVGTAQKYYISMETFYSNDWKKGETHPYSMVIEFVKGIPDPKVAQLLKENAQMQEVKTKSSPPPFPGQKLILSGAFMNLGGLLDRYADPEMCKKELDAMVAIKMDTMIIDTAYPDGAFFDSKLMPSLIKGKDPIENILSYADAHGMKCFLNTGHLTNEWEFMNPEQGKELVEKNKKFDKELFDRYAKHPSFAGWYINYELCDGLLRSEVTRNQLCPLFAELADYLKSLTPGKPVAIAPYFTTNLPPGKFGDLWKDIMVRCHINILMMQDSIGAVNVSGSEEDRFAHLAAYYGDLYRVCKEIGVQCWSDLEVFRQTHGAPIDTKPWSAQPAPADRVIKQIEIEQEYVEKIVIFDYPHYLSPLDPLPNEFGDRATRLYNDYKAYIENRNK